MTNLGIDTGGTFTDLIYIGSDGNEVQTCKAFSTPGDPSLGVVAAVESSGVCLPNVELFTHGTTVATNAILERRGARVGLITTAGHLDRLDLQRCNLTQLYDFFYQRPKALVPRRHRAEVGERIMADGSVRKTLRREELLAAAKYLLESGAEVLAICFLNSYANPQHEIQAKAILNEEFPNLTVVISAEILPEILEYERFSTTTISAFLTPVMDRYLSNLESYLARSDFTGTLLVMQGNGGVMDANTARTRAATTLESGPAAGVTGAIEIADQIGAHDLITFDMGGTSTDVCLVRDGSASTTSNYLIDGLPMRVPLIDIVSVGAGGGSIAWVDEGGGLHVGPQSAGADPGPASYGRGGMEPTVTDAHVVLGRLSPEYPLGDLLRVDPDRAAQAVQKIAMQFDMTLSEAAAGILSIVDSNMVNAIRLVSVERGIDPRNFLLVAYGGAGPLHAARVAAILGLRRVLIPPQPGVHCALGLTRANLRHDFVQTILCPTRQMEWQQIELILAQLEARGRALLASEGITDDQILISTSCDMRYKGQAYVPASVPLANLANGRSWVDDLEGRFHELHERLYQHSAYDEPTEVVSLRLAAIGLRPQHRVTVPRTRQVERQVGRSQVFFEEAGGFIECPVLQRSQLSMDTTLEGPAIIHQMDTTIVVNPGQKAYIDANDNLLLLL